VDVTIDEVRRHAQLEGELTDQLLLTTPETRWNAFSDAYGRLYRDLPWLNETIDQPPDESDFRAWAALVGRKKKLLEIGSGQGRLIRYLAAQGHACHATEITRERGERFLSDESGVRWLAMDGVNLSRFVGKNAFDVIISDQVFEHLHPDDHLTHLREARDVLREDGRYILRAPHRSAGPRDLSAAFGCGEAVFMHLCEPTYALMQTLCGRAGFRRISAVFASRRHGVTVASRLFMKYQILIEKLEQRVAPSHEAKRRFREIAKKLLANKGVWIVAEK
jgi:SAM-dependent methyltransferase